MFFYASQFAEQHISKVDGCRAMNLRYACFHSEICVAIQTTIIKRYAYLNNWILLFSIVMPSPIYRTKTFFFLAVLMSARTLSNLWCLTLNVECEYKRREKLHCL